MPELRHPRSEATPGIHSTIKADPAELLAGEPTAIAFNFHLPDWHADAQCKGQPHNVFFPTRGGSNGPALQLCGRCPVREDCLDEALADTSLDHGIRGGMTVPARQAARKARRL